jgi:DNA sulfur modification protein DndD
MRRNKIEYLQNKTFEMFKKLSNKSDTIQELKIDKETYEIFIYGKDETEIKKSSLSAGEKEVFSISLLWGLAQTSQLKLPIIIDTPLSRLDSVHRENIVKYYFPNAAEQVIILSTDTEVDKKYYQELGNYVIDSKSLKYDRVNDYTYLDSGYFWN